MFTIWLLLAAERFGAKSEYAEVSRLDLTAEPKVLECDGVFISVGRKPATDLVKDQLELDRSGYVVADETTKTAIPGVYISYFAGGGERSVKKH